MTGNMMRAHDPTEAVLMMFGAVCLLIAGGCAISWAWDKWERRRDVRRYLQRVIEHEEHS